MALIAHDETLHELVDAEAEPEQLGTGFGFIEGPVWDAPERRLLFSDVPGDTRWAWSEANGVVEVASPTGKANGMAFDDQGRLYVCHHAWSNVTRIDPNGFETIVAKEYEGWALNSPNDVVVRSDGLVFFTDPHYGRVNPDHGVPRPMELDYRGVYALRPDTRKLSLVADDFEAPNGLCFTSDEATLYVNDSERRDIRRFDVAADGMLSGGEVVFNVPVDDSLGPGNPDGMKLDEHGNIWVSGPGGIWVLTSEGRHLGIIRVPEDTANFCWGEDTELYVCATSSLYRLRTKVRGCGRA
jgi:gluconolactonase